MSEEGKSSTAGCNIEQRKLRSAAQTQLNMCTKGVASSKDTTASTATEADQQPCLVKITFPENYSAFSITFVIKRIFSAITFGKTVFEIGRSYRPEILIPYSRA